MSSFNEAVRRAIARENKVTAQPYVLEDRVAMGRDKAEWDAGKRGKGHRDFILREMSKRVMAGTATPGDLESIKKGPKGDKVYAWVHQGRWVASCLCEFSTGLVCRGLEVVDLDDPVFMCFTCQNAFNEGRLRPVEFPAKKFREDVERLLLARPVYATRNWLIGEGISTLVNENAEHGIPIPNDLKKLIGIQVVGKKDK